MAKIFNGEKKAKLGTEKKPAVVNVRPLHNLPRALKKSPESEFIDFLGNPSWRA